MNTVGTSNPIAAPGAPTVGLELPPGLPEQLKSHRIAVEGRQEVSDYLTRHPEIAALLPDICAKLRQTFGTAELALSVYTDPEIDDRYLSLYVRLDLYATGVIGQIDSVAAEFDEALSSSAGYLLITTDFRRPRGNDGF